MQSSTTVACRAGVMLVCLIAIPLAALFGTRLPDLVEDLLSRLPDLRGLRAGGPFPGTPAFGSTGQAPPWNTPHNGSLREAWDRGSQAKVASRNCLPGGIETFAGTAHRPAEDSLAGSVLAGQSRPESGSFFGPTRHLQATAASYESPVEPTPPSPADGWLAERRGALDGHGSVPGSTDLTTRDGLLGNSTTPALNWPEMASLTPTEQGETSAGLGGPLPSLNPASNRADARLEALQATDRFAYAQRRLRELGATYYALEIWGAQGQYYRFCARIALSPGTDDVRHFEATDADPQAAMAKVLGEVENWRAGQ